VAFYYKKLFESKMVRSQYNEEESKWHFFSAGSQFVHGTPAII
jgi:hypothetical protein